MNQAIEVLVDAAHGQYIPQIFAQQYLKDGPWIHEGNPEDMDILLSGPDHEYYWEAWENVLDNAQYTFIDGSELRLHQDGDLFAYNIQRMTLEEQCNLFDWHPVDCCVAEDCTMFSVASHFIPALYYGDVSGLGSEEDELAYSNFVDKYGDSIVDHLNYGLDTCEITGLVSECAVIVLRDKKENKA